MPTKKIEDAIEEKVKGSGLQTQADTDLQVMAIRLSRSTIETLRTHFSARGLKLSQGIRLIVSDYVRKAGIG